MNNRKDALDAFNRLLDIMDELREKYPWDKKQILKSLRNLTIEETYPKLVQVFREGSLVTKNKASFYVVNINQQVLR